MLKILVSSCLLGERVRYHGGAATLDHPVLERWRDEGRIVAVCPEVAGGLSTPRPAAEIVGGDGTAVIQRAAFVRRKDGADLSRAFLTGAETALALVREHGIRAALLKDGSPSCGRHVIYNGTFTGTRTPGEGVTAAALRAAGVRVFSEAEIEEADAFLRGR